MPNSTGRMLGVVLLLAPICFLGGYLAGRADKKVDQPLIPVGEVIAHVGSEDITRQELENEFRWAAVPSEQQNNSAIVKRVLHDLVVRKFLMQRALAAQLDHAPTVPLDIRRSREQTLANDFVQRTALAKVAEIRDSDVFRYIDSHPLKFAKRTLLTVDEITVPLSAYSQSVADATKDIKSIDEIDHKLTGMGVAHANSIGVLKSGDIPEDLFQVIQTNKADGVFFVRVGSNGVFFKVKSEEASPLEGETAVGLARQFLRAEVFKKELSDAATAADAQVKFEGKYAVIMSGSGRDDEQPGPGD